MGKATLGTLTGMGGERADGVETGARTGGGGALRARGLGGGGAVFVGVGAGGFRIGAPEAKLDVRVGVVGTPGVVLPSFNAFAFSNLSRLALSLFSACFSAFAFSSASFFSC